MAGYKDVRVHGCARGKSSYDIANDQSLAPRARSYAGVATDDGRDGHFGADAVQSRLGFKTVTPEGVSVTVEGDFRPGNLRLRHAFGEYNGVLMGQTWSNYSSFVGNISTLDFDSLPGLAGLQGRVAQARYTSGPLSISLEEPNSSIVTGGLVDGDPAALDVDTKDSMPAFTARLEDSNDGLSYSAAMLALQLGYDEGDADDSSFGLDRKSVV